MQAASAGLLAGPAGAVAGGVAGDWCREVDRARCATWFTHTHTADTHTLLKRMDHVSDPMGTASQKPQRTR